MKIPWLGDNSTASEIVEILCPTWHGKIQLGLVVGKFFLPNIPNFQSSVFHKIPLALVASLRDGSHFVLRYVNLDQVIFLMLSYPSVCPSAAEACRDYRSEPYDEA